LKKKVIRNLKKENQECPLNKAVIKTSQVKTPDLKSMLTLKIINLSRDYEKNRINFDGLINLILTKY
jgi:hypothetical protein